MLQSVTVPDVVQKRKEWKEILSNYDVNKLVFLDESGVNTDMTRMYARTIGGARAVDKTPINTPSNTTILSSIRLNGETAYTTYSGGTTGEKFVDYLKNTLFPTLEKDTVVIMDNMRSHHIKAVAEVANKAGITILYLPPYSPDFNPIEKMWSKIKSILRKMKVRIYDDLQNAIQCALKKISASDCVGWFKSSFLL
jgi:transposase